MRKIRKSAPPAPPMEQLSLIGQPVAVCPFCLSALQGGACRVCGQRIIWVPEGAKGVTHEL